MAILKAAALPPISQDISEIHTEQYVYLEACIVQLKMTILQGVQWSFSVDRGFLGVLGELLTLL